jgi:hypothetical protein
MTTDPLALLRTAEAYLAATHEHASRHDNLGADLTCGGCALRERISVVLTAAASAPADPCHPCGCPRRFNRHADGCPVRDRIVEALLTTPHEGWTYKPGQEKWDHHKHGDQPGHDYAIYCALCVNNVGVLADAVLAVLAAPADRASVLREAANRAWEHGRSLASTDDELGIAGEIQAELLRMADEEQQP